MRGYGAVLECVVNVSEGRDAGVLLALAAAAGGTLLDVHSDPHHHRSVFTLGGGAVVVEADARALAAAAVARLDLRRHVGVHPRLGVVDVVPFVPLGGSTLADAVAARDRFLAWAGVELGLPGFAYGPERTLPDVRRRAFVDLAPDAGPFVPHETAGAVCVGAREVLVAFNVWLADGADLALAREVARAVRGPAVRALGLDVGGRAQVSMNLVDPLVVGRPSPTTPSPPWRTWPAPSWWGSYPPPCSTGCQSLGGRISTWTNRGPSNPASQRPRTGDAQRRRAPPCGTSSPEFGRRRTGDAEPRWPPPCVTRSVESANATEPVTLNRAGRRPVSPDRWSRPTPPNR